MRSMLDFTAEALGIDGVGAPHLVRRYGEDPGPAFTAIPYTDTESAGLTDEAVRALVILRAGSVHDPGAILSVLVSLEASVEARIPDTVWLARTRHGYSWGQVAERLGLTTETARRRYADYVRARLSAPRRRAGSLALAERDVVNVPSHAHGALPTRVQTAWPSTPAADGALD